MNKTVEEIDNPCTLNSVTLPERIAVAIERMHRLHSTGQILINFNSGEPQSFEVKEHHRL